MTGGKFTLGEAIVGLHFNVKAGDLSAAIKQINNLGSAIQSMHGAGGPVPGAAIGEATSLAMKQGQAIIDASAAASQKVTEILTEISEASANLVDKLIKTIESLGRASIPTPGVTQGGGAGPPPPSDPTQGTSGIPEGLDQALGQAGTRIHEIWKESRELSRLWAFMEDRVRHWLPHLQETQKLLREMGIHAGNMNAFLAATKEQFRATVIAQEEYVKNTTQEERDQDSILKGQAKHEALLKRKEDIQKESLAVTTTLGKIEARLPDFVSNSVRSWGERFKIIERSSNLEGRALKRAKMRAQVDRRRARDMLGAAFAITIFGQKLQRLYGGLVESSSDLFFIQDDIADGWEEVGDIIGGDVAPLLEGPIADSFETIIDAVDGMNEGFRGSLGLFILLGTQAASVLGPIMAMLTTRKMIAASAQMQLLTQKQITLEAQRQAKASGKGFTMETKSEKVAKKRSKKAKAGAVMLEKGVGFVKTIGKAFGGMFIIAILIQLMEPFIEIISEIIEMVVEIFLPVVEDVAETLIEWGLFEAIGWVLIKVFDLLVIAVKAVWWVLEGIWGVIKKVVDVLTIIWNKIKDVTKAFKGSGLHAAIQAVIIVVKILMTPINTMITIMKWWVNAILNLIDNLDNIWALMKDIGGFIIGYFTGAWNILKAAVGFVVDIITLDFSGAMDSLKGIFDKVVGFISGVISGGWAILEKAIGIFSSIIGIDLSGAFDLIKGIFDRTVGWVVDIIKRGWDILQGAIAIVSDLLSGDFTEAWEGIKALFVKVVGWILDIILGPLKNLWDALVDIWNAIKDILGFGDEEIDISVNWSGEQLTDAEKDYYKSLYGDRYVPGVGNPEGTGTGDTVFNITVEGDLTEGVVPMLMDETEKGVNQQKRYDP